MKVIVIRQPWAWLIVHGFKDIESSTKSAALLTNVALSYLRNLIVAGSSAAYS
ncbi:MAG: hypothetical protein WBC04_19515 [Candidatus Acidiferrales bacterium]